MNELRKNRNSKDCLFELHEVKKFEFYVDGKDTTFKATLYSCIKCGRMSGDKNKILKCKSGLTDKEGIIKSIII